MERFGRALVLKEVNRSLYGQAAHAIKTMIPTIRIVKIANSQPGNMNEKSIRKSMRGVVSIADW
jgi:hypothetical protein